MSKVSSHGQRRAGSCAPSSAVATSLAVDLEYAGPAAADAAQVVEGKRREAEAVVLEVELERVLAGRERVGAFPADPLQIEQVPQ